MDSPRYTSITRKNFMTSKSNRHSSRSLNPNNPPTYRSKTPQPPGSSRPKSNSKPRKYKKKSKKNKTPRRLLQYRARKDSQPEREIEEELPDYVKATTPQPHMTRNNQLFFPTNQPQLSNISQLQRSKSGHNVYNNYNNNDSPNNNIPQFSPINSHSNSSNYNNGFNTQIPLHPMSIIHSNNTTPIPMNQLPPHNDEFNTNKIRQIPKPQHSQSHHQLQQRRDSNSISRQRADSGINMRPRTDSAISMRQRADSGINMRPRTDSGISIHNRARADSGISVTSVNSQSEYSQHSKHGLLSPKQIEEQIMSHYDSQQSSHSNNNSNSKDKKWGLSILSKKHNSSKDKKNKKRNSKGKIHKKRNSKSHSKPFNDEDDIIAINNSNSKKRNSIEKEQLFANKLHPEYKPLAPPKSQPPMDYKSKHIPQINPIQPLPPYNPMQPPHSYILPIHNNNNNNDDIIINSNTLPYPLNMNNNNNGRLRGNTVGDYNDQRYNEEFMDDKEVANKSFKYNRSLHDRSSPQSQEELQNDMNINVDSRNREMDKMRFRCDQLDWNLNTLQTNTDKDIRQVTAKIHRVEHDIATQNELNNRSNKHTRRNSIFNSLDSSIATVIRNVDSIKDALQTLDLRMSIINQRQHDIFKHIDETKDLLSQTHIIENEQPKELILNEMDKTSLNRRASLQSMSEMLRLQTMNHTMNESKSSENMHMNEMSMSNNNPLILPTYDDNEDILNPKSNTNKKLISHIRPELLIQNNQQKNDIKSLITQRVKPKNSVVSYKSSGDYTITIERTRVMENWNQNHTETQENVTDDKQKQQSESNNKLDSIVEMDGDDSSTESMLSQERNTAPISIPPMDDETHNISLNKQTSLSRRSHRRSNIDSGLSDQLISAIKSQTMIVYSSDSDSSIDIDEKAIETNNINNNSDIDEEKQYIINKENRRKKNKSRSKNRRSNHSRNINISQDENNTSTMGGTSTNILNNIDMKTLELPLKENRKYSESYSININENNNETHNKNTLTHTTPIGMLKQFNTNNRKNKPKTKASDIFNINHENNKAKVPNFLEQTPQNMNKRRAGSMSYDIGKESNIVYERELSVKTDDPLGLKFNINDTQQPLPDDENDDDEDDDDSMSELSIDSMSDLSADGNNNNNNNEQGQEQEQEEEDSGTFVVHGNTLAQALAMQEQEENEEKELQIFEKLKQNSKNKNKTKKDKKSKKDKKKKKKYIQLMNCKFVLHQVPYGFDINDFMRNELKKKASYLLHICNNTTSHDLFFKYSYIYKSKSKCLKYFKQMNEYENDNNCDNIISIDGCGDESDDHLAPNECMTFGDINIKKGYNYCGYFVFEAYPFPNINDDEIGMNNTAITSLITPHNKDNNNNNNPLTPKLKTHTILTAIDEKQKHEFGQYNELKLGSMSPSTANKFRRQSLSTSRRTSLQFTSPLKYNTMSQNEHSVISLLDKALDEENNNNCNVWNDDLDDLIDVIIGYDIELSIGDPQLNVFKCYVQFNQYSQPMYYQKELPNLDKLKEFCNGGSDGLQLLHNELITKVNVNYKNTIHPKIIFDIGYNKLNGEHIVKEPSMNETLDID